LGVIDSVINGVIFDVALLRLLQRSQERTARQSRILSLRVHFHDDIAAIELS